ncbi:hypothetical protein GWI33_005851 [Rhynchophorus ferrugineus]|uniref:Uncharacterized protein n=1 Tax=Rhynchophorus ferrugineus TaxID=354439 RepID=A0A834MHP4_RHYFE|nr:hypothetical protein GWI33_005851 [Rhynchophorus ferrugineus]
MFYVVIFISRRLIDANTDLVPAASLPTRENRPRAFSGMEDRKGRRNKFESGILSRPVTHYRGGLCGRFIGYLLTIEYRRPPPRLVGRLHDVIQQVRLNFVLLSLREGNVGFVGQN